MKSIEPAKRSPDESLTPSIRDFWERNVNAEQVFGRSISPHARGESGYFADLSRQRFRSHRHLRAWINTMQAGQSVLEIGCGVGLDAYEMARRGVQLTAADLTTVAVQTARRRFQSEQLPGQFVCTDAGHLPFPDHQFDCVYSFGVLHHAADTQQCIQEVWRVLKPGGVARIMLYNRHSINEWVHQVTRIPFEEKNECCPVARRFSRAEIQAMFSAFGRLEMHLDFVFGEGYGFLFRSTPRWLYNVLSRYLGWHWMITALK